MIPVENTLVPRVSKSHCSSTLAGTLVRLAEQNKWHGPLPLVHAIMSTRLVSNNYAQWPIYGLDTNCMDFNVGIQNPYEITPPQVVRIMPISHELQLARRKSFHQCVSLVHAVMWTHLVLKTLTCIVFIARRRNFTHFPGTSFRTSYCSYFSGLACIVVFPYQVRWHFTCVTLINCGCFGLSLIVCNNILCTGISLRWSSTDTGCTDVVGWKERFNAKTTHTHMQQYDRMMYIPGIINPSIIL